jgi:hypothetical protein
MVTAAAGLVATVTFKQQEDRMEDIAIVWRDEWIKLSKEYDELGDEFTYYLFDQLYLDQLYTEISIK